MKTDAMASQLDVNQITEKVIVCAYRVMNDLGCGFLEKIYENALAYEIRKSGTEVQQQHLLKVYSDGQVMGEYFADLLIENTVIVELKTAKAFDPIHTAQCLNYLKATGTPVAILFNFGTPRVEVKRLVM
jgi:GxxExxY protein